MRMRANVWAAMLLCAALWSVPCAAGPITPPPGPVAGTGKTLTEVEPRVAINAVNTPGDASSVFRITQPGSYYLTGNIISNPFNRHVISIAADGVTIDLNGFLIRGLGTLQGAFDCIFAETGSSRIAIKNGHVEIAGRHGVNLENAPSCLVESVTASSCVARGISVGDFSTVVGCAGELNSLLGIVAGIASILSECSARDNGSLGLFAGSGSTISACTASGNGGVGITASAGSTISGCTAYANAYAGIDANFGCTITGCTTYANIGSGIYASTGCTISGCTAYANANDGINASSDCRIVGNTCSENGSTGDGAGILTSFDNRIEDNNCSDNDRGIEVVGGGNIILRNTCTGNTTNYFIAANNRYGPIINITASGTAAVNGNSASDTSGSSHPWANFAY